MAPSTPGTRSPVAAASPTHSTPAPGSASAANASHFRDRSHDEQRTPLLERIPNHDPHGDVGGVDDDDDDSYNYHEARRHYQHHHPHRQALLRNYDGGGAQDHYVRDDENSDDDYEEEDDLEAPLVLIPRKRRPFLEILKSHLRPTSIFFFILFFLASLPAIWLLLRKSLTMPLAVKELRDTYEEGAFSAEAAWNHLKIISERSHAYNSDENLLVRSFLVDVVGEFKALAESRDAGGGEEHEHDGDSVRATPRGKDYIEVAPDNINATLELANLFYESNSVIVRVRGTSPTREALLVSAHFDSTPVSHGVTDDGIAVAAMLELIRTLIYTPQLAHDVILLFDNGEEMNLLGADAFTLHPWFKNVKGFINLEGAGAAGSTRSVLVRTNSYGLVKMWKRSAPYPHASVIGNDLLSIVKSDTNYRPFSTVGRLQGIDVAFYANRYLYHTPRDDLNHSQPIAMQQMGDNLRAMVTAVCGSDLLYQLDWTPPLPRNETTLPPPNFVYYDFLGSFTLTTAAYYKGVMTLEILVVLTLLAVKMSVEYRKLGPRRLLALYVKPTFEAYLLIWLTLLASLFSTFVLSSIKSSFNRASTYARPLVNVAWILPWTLATFAVVQLLWPRIALRLRLRSRRIELGSLEAGASVLAPAPGAPVQPGGGGGGSRRATSGIPIDRWIPYGLLGFWVTLVLVALERSMAGVQGLYFLSDWAFYSIVAVGVTQAAAPHVMRWWRAEVRGEHMWGVQLLPSAVPTLLTIDIMEGMVLLFPPLANEGLSETLIDMISALLLCLLYINLLPAIHLTSRRFMAAFFFVIFVPLYLTACFIFPFTVDRPHIYTFKHTWNITDAASALNSTAVLTNARTLSSGRFQSLSQALLATTPTCDDSLACTFDGLEPPTVEPAPPSSPPSGGGGGGGGGEGSRRYDNATALIEVMGLSAVPLAGGIGRLELRGEVVGLPGSRVCTILVGNVTSLGAPLGVEAFWVDPESEGRWVAPPSTRPGAATAGGATGTRAFAEGAARRVRVPFRAVVARQLDGDDDGAGVAMAGVVRQRRRLDGGEDDGVGPRDRARITVTCYVGEEGVSGFWDHVVKEGGLPKWTSPAHGKFGGVQVFKEVEVEI
ncbi:hypothetical protein HK101_010052 [Irineochytrium annulatum]|nr:hypothetical protein HK101_010052 [Irineochytrium annulatum]